MTADLRCTSCGRLMDDHAILKAWEEGEYVCLPPGFITAQPIQKDGYD